MVYFCRRYFKHELRHLKYIASDLDSGNVCPACFEVKFIYVDLLLLLIIIMKSYGIEWFHFTHKN